MKIHSAIRRRTTGGIERPPMLAALWLSALIVGCGTPIAPMPDVHVADAAADSSTVDGSVTCHIDTDCSDRVFCNGMEMCMPGAAGADARGCVAAALGSPCVTGQTCDEAGQRCISNCTTDADGDGQRALSCGGSDCDDSDPNRFPGNPEVCDVAGHDEDCDPCTVAGASPDGDADHDSFVSVSCYNTYAGPTPSCDPLRSVTDARRTRVTGSDCDDTNPNVRPNQSEICDGIDNNCNSMTDEGDPGGGGSCGSPSPNVCRMGVNHCSAGALTCQIDFSTTGYCCPGFADCNGMTGDGCEVPLSIDARNCGSCGTICPSTAGMPSCISGVCGYVSCASPLSPCGGTCVNMQSDPLNCGACGSACPTTRGVAACAGGMCGYSSCVAGGTICGSDCCVDGLVCRTGRCLLPAGSVSHGGACHDTSECAGSLLCDLTLGGVCVFPPTSAPHGAACLASSECMLPLVCNRSLGGVCAYPDGTAPHGASCVASVECASPFVCDPGLGNRCAYPRSTAPHGAACVDTSECAAGLVCDPSIGNVCAYPYATAGHGVACINSRECTNPLFCGLGGYCVYSHATAGHGFACIDSWECTNPMVCDAARGNVCAYGYAMAPYAAPCFDSGECTNPYVCHAGQCMNAYGTEGRSAACLDSWECAYPYSCISGYCM